MSCSAAVLLQLPGECCASCLQELADYDEGLGTDYPAHVAIVEGREVPACCEHYRSERDSRGSTPGASGVCSDVT